MSKSGNRVPVAAPLNSLSSVYGPVRSWRVGWSLGIDLLCVNSICNFNCVYCQLGEIQVRINGRQLFVPCDKLKSDLLRSSWKRADIATFSGNGEPTLASNLGEAIDLVKTVTDLPVLVLTNGILLESDPALRCELRLADQVYIKLDAASERTFQRVNRPVPGVKLDAIVRGAIQFRSEYKGHLGIQCMFLKSNASEAGKMGELIRRIGPDEVQVNLPTRPYPSSWVPETRGSHEKQDYEARPIQQLAPSVARDLVELIQETSGIDNIRSVHFDQAGFGEQT